VYFTGVLPRVGFIRHGNFYVFIEHRSRFRQTDRHTQTDRQTDRQTNRETHTDTQTDQPASLLPPAALLSPRRWSNWLQLGCNWVGNLNY